MCYSIICLPTFQSVLQFAKQRVPVGRGGQTLRLVSWKQLQAGKEWPACHWRNIRSSVHIGTNPKEPARSGLDAVDLKTAIFSQRCRLLSSQASLLVWTVVSTNDDFAAQVCSAGSSGE